LFCANSQNSLIVEPMDLPENVISNYKANNIKILKGAIEELKLPKVDEVWLFNVMQHVWNPDTFISKLKKVSKKIVFFEPVNSPIEDVHPHSFTMEDFKKYFGEDSVKFFAGRTEPNFHTSDCVYGTWNKIT